MELGIDRFLFFGANAPSGPGTNPVPDLLEEVETAEVARLYSFGLGEHHTGDFADSSPAVLLSAAAARTSCIRLSSAITILSVADPVRVMEDFATLDLVSKGRAEIIVGRGAYAEAFSLFGADPRQYDALAAEKLDLLLQLRSGKPVHWRGRFRPTLSGQITYPRPIQAQLPIWAGATGSPETFVRAGRLGLPLALAVLGGPIRQFRPMVDLYRQAGAQAGHAKEHLKVAVHTIGFVGDTPEKARATFLPGYNAVFGAMGAEVGRPAITSQQFDTMTGADQVLTVGDQREVAAKLADFNSELGGVSRICLQMTVGPLEREIRLNAIRQLGSIASLL